MRNLSLVTAGTRRSFIILIVLTMCLLSANAQEQPQTKEPVKVEATPDNSAPKYKIVDGEIVNVKSTQERAKKEPIKTEYTRTVKGVKYPVYQGSKGGLYIIRVSKKSGKEYKQYFKI